MKIYSRADVRRKNCRESLWIIVGDKILDVTRWRQTHPGGEELLLAHGGEDCTNAFDAFHHPRVKRRLEEF